MNMNRNRPPKDGKDLDVWLSGTINDAIRDAVEAGLDRRSAAFIVLTLGRFAASDACLTWRDIEEIVGRV